jgi:hypothetical protein
MTETYFLIVPLYFAGFTLTMILIANFIAPAKLDYRSSVARMEPLHREIFNVHCLYTMLTVGGMAALCFVLPGELIDGSRLARALLSFLGGYWGLRVLVQLFYYGGESKERFPIYNILFTLAFVYLGLVFLGLAICTTFYLCL